LSRRLSVSQFIDKSRRIHGDKYLYDKVFYVNNTTPVIITCLIHGDFIQAPRGHLWGSGCPKCYYDVAGDNSRLTTDDFIKTASKIHKEKYEYGLVDYRNMFKKVKITCTIHGTFEQIPLAHLRGQGCPKCGKEHVADCFRLTKAQFVAKSCHVHGDKYSYDLVDYRGQDVSVSIICPVHGIFKQKPLHHFIGHGCPKCGHSISRGESELFDWLSGLGYNVESRNKKVLSGKELDIYLPDNSFAVEYNGVYAHSSAYPGNDLKTKHVNKTECCDKIGIRLIQLWDFEWQKSKKQCQNLILAVLQGNIDLEIKSLKNLYGVESCGSRGVAVDRRLSDGKAFKDYSFVKYSNPNEYVTDGIGIYSSGFNMFKDLYYIYDCGQIFLKKEH
jgi:ssDNA-binding Zn-finger/Zn-ribbon topoisomerase 1